MKARILSLFLALAALLTPTFDQATTVTLRGTASHAASFASYNQPFPSGSAAGDLAVVTLGGGWTPNVPSGWTKIAQDLGPNWQGMSAYKFLTAGDISTGTVTLTLSGGTFDAVSTIATFVGSTVSNVTPIRAYSSAQNGSSITSKSLTISTYPSKGDGMFYHDSARVGSGTYTCSPGTVKETPSDGGSGSGQLCTDSLSADGSVTQSWTLPGNSGSYQTMIDIAVATPVSLDGTSNCVTAANNSSAALTLTTANTNDLIVIKGFIANTSSGQAISGISDTAGLSWTFRVVSSGNSHMEEWYATSSGTLSSDTITVSFNSSVTAHTDVCAFGVSGTVLGHPFDAGSVPVTTAGPTTASVTTLSANDFIVAMYHFSSGSPGAVSPFGAVGVADTASLTEAQVFATAQTSLAAQAVGSPNNVNGGIIDAFTSTSSFTLSALPQPPVIP